MEIRRIKEKVKADFQKGYTCYNNEWRGFPKETGKAMQKLWFKRDGRSVAALVCDTSGTRRAWCLCASKKQTKIDINGAWCLLECIDTATKEMGKKKAGKSDLDFDPSWDEWSAELLALGAWRKAYAESTANHNEAIAAHFSDRLAGKEVVCTKQAGTFKSEKNAYAWFAEKRVGDDGPGIRVRCSFQDIHRYGIQMSLVAEAEEII